MSHLHIPDGVLPLPWIAVGIILTALFICLALAALRRRSRARVVSRIAALSAVMLLAMSLPIPVLGYHVNLTVLAGIIAGPAEGFIAAFITNLILALMAHGGITVVGLNTLVTGLEVGLGWLIWRSVGRALRRPFAAAAVSTVIVLLISTTAMIGIVAGTQINPNLVIHRHDHADHADHTDHTDHTDHADHFGSVKAFATVIYAAGAVGWAVEALVVGSVTEFIAKSRPDMLDRGSGKDREA